MQRRQRQGIELDSTDLCVSPQYKQALQLQGLRIVTESRWLNTVVVEPVAGALGETPDWSQFAFVDRYERVSGFEPTQPMASSKFRQEWLSELTMTEKSDFWLPMLEVHGEALFDAGLRGQNMLIVVLDGGFQNLCYYPFLMQKVDGWYDCYAPAETSGAELWRASNHGTHVLSTMATDSAYGVWGTAPDARYYLIRTESSDTETPLEEDMWVRGAEIADSIGADLINSSLGYAQFDDAVFDHRRDDLCAHRVFVSQGARVACRKGMLVCNSAGNERMRPWQTINFPADEEDVFTIGGTDTNLEPSLFTSVGWMEPYVKPDVSCRATDAWVINAQTGYPGVASGTSFASPFMCGLMASLWSGNPSLSPVQLMRIVRATASQSALPDNLLGYGLPDFSKALAQVHPDLSHIRMSAVERNAEASYNLQGQTCLPKGLCITRHKVIFIK